MKTRTEHELKECKIKSKSLQPAESQGKTEINIFFYFHVLTPIDQMTRFVFIIPIHTDAQK